MSQPLTLTLVNDPTFESLSDWGHGRVRSARGHRCNFTPLRRDVIDVTSLSSPLSEKPNALTNLFCPPATISGLITKGEIRAGLFPSSRTTEGRGKKPEDISKKQRERGRERESEEEEKRKTTPEIFSLRRELVLCSGLRSIYLSSLRLSARVSVEARVFALSDALPDLAWQLLIPRVRTSRAGIRARLEKANCCSMSIDSPGRGES